MPTQANTEHDLQHQQDNLGQSQTIAPSLERLMGKESSLLTQKQQVPNGRLVAASAERMMDKEAPKMSQHTVQAGEGLWTIAQKYNPLAPVTEIAQLVQKIVELNKLGSVKALIAPGQTLKVPSTINIGNKQQSPKKASPKIDSKVNDKLRALEQKMMGHQPDHTRVYQPPIFEGKKVNKKNTPKKVNTPKKAKKRIKPDFSLNGIKDTLKRKGYKFYKEEGKVNLIAIRMDDVYDNKFTDKLFIIQKVNDKTEMKEIPWTTTAGTLAHGGVLDPLNAVETQTGVAGTATMIENQYEDVYTFIDAKNYQNLWLKYPYLYQTGSMDYYRDNNKDLKLDRGKVYKGFYGTNAHRMSNNGMASSTVNAPGVPWSQGCQGAPEPEFKKLLPFFRKHVQAGHGKITYTLLNYSDFVD